MSLRIPAILAALAGAVIAQQKPDPPPPKNPIFENRPRGPSAWERIQDPIDRSTGRIVDDSTYQIDRFQRERDEAYRRTIPQAEYQRFEEERERRLRIESRQQVQIRDEQARRRELDRREYEVRLYAGYMTTGQAAADDRALMLARGRRDEQLVAAQNERAELLRNQPGERARIETGYQDRVNVIRSEYEKERGRILGVDSAASPATQPQP